MQVLPPGLDRAILMKNGKIPPEEDLESINFASHNKPSNFNQSVVDNLTESESLEQDGVLVVNISNDNVLNINELYPSILQLSNYSSKADEITNKIQSNSREITGDSKNNIKFKDLSENITVAPAPTNGVLPTNEVNEDIADIEKVIINKTSLDKDGKGFEGNELVKPTESLQSLTGNSNHKRHRRRRHGNGRR